MLRFRNVLARAVLAAGIVGGALAATSEPAAARVVCDRFHCWHVRGYGGYYDPYYDPYYGPAYYGPGVTFGFGFGGGGHHWHGGGGHGHGGGGHGGGGHHH